MEEIDKLSSQPWIPWTKTGLTKRNMMTQPRQTAHEQIWKVSQDAMCWVDINGAQKNGLKFYQTRSNAINLFDTLSPTCIERVVSGEIVGYDPLGPILCRPNLLLLIFFCFFFFFSILFFFRLASSSFMFLLRNHEKP